MAIHDLRESTLGLVAACEASRKAVQKHERSIPYKGGPVVSRSRLRGLKGSGEGALSSGCVGVRDLTREVSRRVRDRGSGRSDSTKG